MTSSTLKVSAAYADGAPPASDAQTVVNAARRAGGTIRFEHLGKAYPNAAGANGSIHALQDIDLEIPAGCVFGIIGRSGAGKSSLLRTINLLERPTAGKVLIDGVDVGALGERDLVNLRRRVGMIFQHFNLLSAKTVRDNVALPLLVAGVPAREAQRRASELLSMVGLLDKQHAYPARLSGGQKQRAGIARALATNPEILLCDEATSALDPETTRTILDLLRDINRRLGITIVLITHEMSVIREIADEVLVLDHGRVAELGPAWKVLGAPEHPTTQALLAPLRHALPADLADRLQAQPPANGAPFEQIVQLSYRGKDRLEPDFARIAQVFHAGARLIDGGIDRIQGHAQGRLLLAVPGNVTLPADLSGWTRGNEAIAHHVEIVGYAAV